MSAMDLPTLQFLFVSEILPKIETHGRIYYRGKRPDLREELIAEMVALCWKWFLRLVDRGKDATEFASAFAGFAARAVNSGRRVCGHEAPKDCLSETARKRHGFSVEKLPDHDTGQADALDALRDNNRTPPPDQAHFRDAFPRWLSHLADRICSLAQDMLQGETTATLAVKYEVSASRISQLRRELHESWTQFCS